MSNCTHGNLTAHGRECPWCHIAELELENAKLRVGQSLLRKLGEPLPAGCYCASGKCAAPKPSWCRDINKRDALLGVGNE
mgnify:CR=1 FL=1